MHFCFSILGVYHFPPQGGEIGHQKTNTHLHRYMGGDWETLQEEQTIRAHAMVSQRSSTMAPDPTPPPLAQLCHAHAIAHVREYTQTMRTLVPNILVAPLIETHCNSLPFSSIG
jgi:hypothetical protein